MTRSTSGIDRPTDETRYGRRLAAQADYQRRYRETQRKARAPTRNDVANVMLFWFIRLLVEKEDHLGLSKVRGVLIADLVAQGFDRERSARRVDGIVESIEDGWTPRPKPHLKPKPDGLTLVSLMGEAPIDVPGDDGIGADEGNEGGDYGTD